jgi:hypothetical protein
MPAPTWTVSRPVRVWRIRPGEWALLCPGCVITALDWQGGNRVCVHAGQWCIIPPGALDALVIVPPERRAS